MSENKQKWYRLSGAEGDVVVSTRIRLARNLSGTPFPAGMTGRQKQEIIRTVDRALEESGEAGDFRQIEMGELPLRSALSLAERHLISPEFARVGDGGALLLNGDESAALMLNEEDHLRLQIMRPGLDLHGAFREADRLDTLLDNRLHFAFDSRLGYLTQCPTNLGTGMRASLMLHLPALQERGAIQQLAVTVSKLGLTIRGLYGEGSKPQGALYQLSNQVTLGISEQEAIDNLAGIAAQILREERTGREQWGQNPRFEDMVWRSLGLLRTARLLTGDEFMTLISNLRLGIAMGTLPDLSLETADALIGDVQPATLMSEGGRDMESAERDALRARIVRERLS